MRKFNNRAVSFSKVNLAYLSHCANFAYESKDKVATELQELGFDVSRDNFYFSDNETDTQAFVAGDRQKIIVSFRGTEGKVIEDWMTDARILKDEWTEANPVGEVHNGFYNALTSVWDDIMDEISTLRTNNQAIWITGHSLGGSLATLAAATLRLQLPEISLNGVYTFGQPRLGTQTFSKAYNDKIQNITFRCVNNNDVVARVPPQIFGYSHVGILKYFDSDGELHSDSSLSWWAKFWDRVEGRFDNILSLTPDGIADHSMDTYQELAESLI